MRTPKRKKLLAQIALIAIFIILALGISLLGKRTPAEEPKASNEQIVVEKISDTGSRYYDITAEYPTSGPGSDTVRKDVLDMISKFKTENDPTYVDEDPRTKEGFQWKYTLTISYEYSTGSGFLSHLLSVYTYTGGAHGGNAIITYTIDPEGNMVEISDLFTDPAIGLPFLSKLAKDTILATPQYQETVFPGEWLDSGIEPTPENFSAFGFVDNTFILIFQQYQIAPYSAGNITIRVPKETLDPFLKAKYRTVQ